jgi:hypothetical protein
VVLGGASSRQILLVNVVEFLNQTAVSIPKPEQALDDNFFGRRVEPPSFTCTCSTRIASRRSSGGAKSLLG